MKRTSSLLLAALIMASPGWAQAPYITGAIGVEMVRSTSVASAGSTFDPDSGDTWNAALRAGTLVAPRVGVEVEWLRPGELESDGNGPIYIAGDLAPGIVERLAGARVFTDLTIFPIISQETRLRTSTVSTLAFVRQPVGQRVDLVYLGGVGFSRVVREIEYGFPRPLLAAARAALPSYRTRTTQYGVGPVVGVEARIGMTEHAGLVTGVRLHALGQPLIDGWIVRPSLGLAWSF